MTLLRNDPRQTSRFMIEQQYKCSDAAMTRAVLRSVRSAFSLPGRVVMPQKSLFNKIKLIYLFIQIEPKSLFNQIEPKSF